MSNLARIKSRFLDIDDMEPDKYWTSIANEQKEAKSIHAHTISNYDDIKCRLCNGIHTINALLATMTTSTQNPTQTPPKD